MRVRRNHLKLYLLLSLVLAIVGFVLLPHVMIAGVIPVTKSSLPQAWLCISMHNGSLDVSMPALNRWINSHNPELNDPPKPSYLTGDFDR